MYFNKIKHMKRFIILAFIAFATITAAQAQVTETRKINKPDGISVSTNIKAIIMHSNRHEVIVDADNQSILDKIETVTNNGILQIRVKPNTQIQNMKQVRVTVYTDANMHKFKASANAGIDLREDIKVDQVDIQISSNAQMRATSISAKEADVSISSNAQFDGSIIAEELDVDVSSNAKANIAGKVKELEANASSNGTLNIRKLSAERIESKVSSNGKIIKR